MTKPEAPPIVAWRYVPSEVRCDYDYTDEPARVELAKSFNLKVEPLTDHAQATAQLAALQAKAQQMALDHLASEGQWIEHTGKLSEQVAALQAEVERLRPMAERYEFVRSVSYPGERHGPDEMPLSYYQIRLRVDTPVYHPGTWWSYVDSAIDQARLAHKVGSDTLKGE